MRPSETISSAGNESAPPARTLVTLTAIVFGAVAATFGIGLGISASRAAEEALAAIRPTRS
jgi:hypothetical protein